jgi:prepilin-type N-terminal cleavage/methylation domain-containing protein
MRRRQDGFSLIELLIVVAIILIIMAIAIPSFLNSRMAANEASAVQSVKAVTTAESAYSTLYPNIGYSALLSDLGDGGTSPCIATTGQACLLDDVLASGIKSGYQITYVQDATFTPSSSYKINADPLNRGSSGRRSFYTDTPGVIRYNATAPATATDPVI